MTALNAGVRSIEHGFMFDCEIAEADEGKECLYHHQPDSLRSEACLDIPAVKNVPASLAKARSRRGATFAGYHRQHE